MISYDSNVNDKTIIKVSVTSDTLICLVLRFFLLICSSDIIITPLIRKRRTRTPKHILWFVFYSLGPLDPASVSTEHAEVKLKGLCAAW